MIGILENVKVGDKLLVYINQVKGIETVERITATLVITKLHRFRKDNGYAQGSGGWTIIRAILATDKDIAEARHRQLAHKCEGVDFKSLSVPQLEAILKIVNQE